MSRNIIIALIVAGAAIAVPALYREHPQIFEAVLRAATGNNSTKTPDVPEKFVDRNKPAPSNLSGRKVRIDAARNGHFVADFKLNGRRVTALVDTGATIVAINESTARRIGIHLAPADFKHPVRTANGTTKAASTTIESLEIGRIRVENVEAAILDDRALSDTLVGMSFLKRLRHFSVKDGTLELEQ